MRTPELVEKTKKKSKPAKSPRLFILKYSGNMDCESHEIKIFYDDLLPILFLATPFSYIENTIRKIDPESRLKKSQIVPNGRSFYLCSDGWVYYKEISKDVIKVCRWYCSLTVEEPASHYYITQMRVNHNYEYNNEDDYEYVSSYAIPLLYRLNSPCGNTISPLLLSPKKFLDVDFVLGVPGLRSSSKILDKLVLRQVEILKKELEPFPIYVGNKDEGHIYCTEPSTISIERLQVLRAHKDSRDNKWHFHRDYSESNSEDSSIEVGEFETVFSEDLFYKVSVINSKLMALIYTLQWEKYRIEDTLINSLVDIYTFYKYLSTNSDKKKTGSNMKIVTSKDDYWEFCEEDDDEVNTYDHFRDTQPPLALIKSSKVDYQIIPEITKSSRDIEFKSSITANPVFVPWEDIENTIAKVLSPGYNKRKSLYEYNSSKHILYGYFFSNIINYF